MIDRLIRCEEDEEEEDLNKHWLCICGNYETSGMHCSGCGHSPPWGCDCGCEDPEPDSEDCFPWEY
jgi:hypothetical protein